MLNTYNYFPGGFAAIACLSGSLLHYQLSDPPASSVFTAVSVGTLEISDRGSGRITSELRYTDNSQEDVKIAHRGSGRVGSDRL